jgi:ATP-dependent Clp protease ATP-binding subunit ClpA
MKGSNVSPWSRLRDLEDQGSQKAQDALRWFDDYSAQVGYALDPLSDQLDTLQGRDTELEQLDAVMMRPVTPVALLIGDAGVGKTALVSWYAQKANNRYLVLSLRLGRIATIGTHRLQAELSRLLDRVGEFEKIVRSVLNDPSIRVILFIDEIHMLVTIFGAGTKIGGDVVKDALAKPPVRVIAATTKREYDSTIAVDKPLAERFKQIELKELSRDIVKSIATHKWQRMAPDCELVSSDVIERIIDTNAAYRPDNAEPRKTIDILEDLVSYCRRTGKRATVKQVDEVFKNRYSINLNFEVDADTVYGEIARRIQGQPHALYTLRRLLSSMVYQIDQNLNKPIVTALFTGPTGVGKTETCKAIASVLYPGEDVLLPINCPDYKTAEHEASFRKRLGEYIRHTPNALVLLDELEKAHESILDSMLNILDEGIIHFEVTNREGSVEVNSASLRNAIVIATTNAGSKVFDDDAKFSQREVSGGDQFNASMEAEMDQLYRSLVKNLMARGFKPEMLGRFSRIVPYRSLASNTLISIAEKEVERILTLFYKKHGIEISMREKIEWPKDSWDCIATDLVVYIVHVKASAEDSRAGGAREIKRLISQVVLDSAIDAITEHPECKHFSIYASGDSKVYDQSASATEGGVVVEPLQ